MPDLSSAACYPHPVHGVRRMETHISVVYLTGELAYKLKKPVDLGFLDFTTLEARRRCCEDELRLNRRLAPQLYLAVVPVRGTLEAPRLYGEGPVVDYAVMMREFPQDALASRMLEQGRLTEEAIIAFASRIARFHAEASADAQARGTSASVRASAMQNFEQIAPCLARRKDRDALARLRSWTEREFAAVAGRLDERHARGRVREVHGDLHLGNIVCLNGELLPFDCIEFSAELRWNDVMSEVAFLMMDLADRSAAHLGDLFLDAYLAHTGDFDGLAVLRFFVVYRALVRAKIHLMRAQQVTGDASERRRLMGEYRRYVRLASASARPRKRFVLLMHGLAASGKSTIARGLLQMLDAVRIRSDVERKRLAGLDARAATYSPVGGGLYSADRSIATYERLAELATIACGAGYPAIIDATFIRREHRERALRAARSLNVPCLIVDVDAPVEALRERLQRRARAGGDASEATAAVLERQLEMQEPLTAAERRRTVVLDGKRRLSAADCERIARRVGAGLDVKRLQRLSPS